MSNAKQYSTDVSCSDEWVESPETATFAIDKETAEDIIKLSQLVRDNGLYKVEKFDYRVTYYKQNPEDLEDDEVDDADDDASNEVRTDCDCISVSGDEFWFSACTKNTSIEYVTSHQPIKELADHFGIEFTASR